MKAHDVLRRVEEIKHIPDNGIHDNEQQHVEEDALWHDVLLAIAEGEGMEAIELRALAKAALTTKELSFCRWYA